MVSGSLFCRLDAAQVGTTVEVRGQGSSHWEARTDCIRQALQLTMKQLIIADRHVEDDRLLKDSVLSTMNGYVDAFEILNEVKQDGVVTITARVTVSPTRVENFLGGYKRGSTKVEGSAILSEIQRDKLAREARTEILARLFAGFPSSAFDSRIKHIGLENQSVTVQVEVRASKTYIGSLRNGLDVLRKSAPNDNGHGWNVCFADGQWLVAAKSCVNVSAINVQTNLCPSLMSCFYNSGELAFAYKFSGNPSVHVASAQPETFRDLAHWSPNYSQSFTIDQAAHVFQFSIPASEIPDASKELRVVPLFIINRYGKQLIRDLSESGTVSVGSPEFDRILNDLLNF